MSTVEAAAPIGCSTFGAVLNGLTHLSHWRGRTIVIKYGGAAMAQADLRASFARDVARLRAAGTHPVIVHGGGPQIDALMRRVGKSPRFVGGLRVTDEETMELVEMVLVGKINLELKQSPGPSSLAANPRWWQIALPRFTSKAGSSLSETGH